MRLALQCPAQFHDKPLICIALGTTQLVVDVNHHQRPSVALLEQPQQGDAVWPAGNGDDQSARLWTELLQPGVELTDEWRVDFHGRTVEPNSLL
jgi:hypothetical protein